MSRRSGWRLALAAGAAPVAAVVVAVVALLAAPPVAAAERDPLRFQPVKLVGGKFVGVGDSGPFTTQFENGVPFGDSDVDRSKVTADNVGKFHQWGSRGSKNGMIIDNSSGQAICMITIVSTNADTFPKDPKVYQMPSGWTAKVSDDGKTLTISADKQPDGCVPKDGHLWMKVPASPTPDEGDATLKGKLTWLDPSPGSTTSPTPASSTTQAGTPLPSATG